jgi:hypothetical protein
MAVAEAREAQHRASSARVRARRIAEDKIAVKAIVAKVREVALLDMPVALLNGATKALRFCLGRELAELGAAYARIAEKVEPDEMIGERLTEAEVRGLLAGAHER